MGTEIKGFAIGHGARRAIGKIANRGAGGHRAAEDVCVRGESEPVVQSATLIGLEMRKANIAQGAGIENLFDLAPDGVKESRMAGVNSMNLASILRSHARSRPDHPAIEFQGDILDYRTLWQQVASYAGALIGLDVQPGDRVGLALAEHPPHLMLHYALAHLGAVLLPLDHRWTSTEIQAVADAFGARLVIVEAECDCPPETGWYRLDEAWANLPHVSLPPMPETPEMPLLISLSSGTTGGPKGALVTHQQMYERFINQWVTLSFNVTDRFVSVTPMYFGGGRSFTMSFLAAGATVILDPLPHTPEALVELIRTSRASVTFMVPTILRRLLPLAKSEQGELLTGLRRLLVSGAVLYAEEAQAMRQHITSQLIGYYASSEGGGISILQPGEIEAYADTVGRPSFRVELEVVDERGISLPDQAIGRLRYRGPGVATTFLDKDGREEAGDRTGWFYPGDLASIGPRGHVTLHGREKDVIIRGGVNIYPAEVERVLMDHASIREAAVVPWASPELGEEVAAFIVLSQVVSDADIFEFCREHLASYKVPSALFPLDALPKARSDKIDKGALQARLPERS